MKPAAYARLNKPLCMPVQRLRIEDLDSGGYVPPVPNLPPVRVPKELECHVTPPAVALRLAQLLPDMAGRAVLEPSAGTGNILDALGLAHPLATVQGVEIYRPLCERLWTQGHTVDCADFESWAADTRARFDAVVMNPPFRRVRQHIKAALRLLVPGGVLVALVPITYDQGREIERLPVTTFAAAQVHTKVVTMTAP